MSSITPADVKTFSKPTDKFLCSPGDNTYGLDFQRFTVSDYDTKKVIFKVSKDAPPPPDMSLSFVAQGKDIYPTVGYKLSEDVLRLPFVQTSMVFSVGPKEVRGEYMC